MSQHATWNLGDVAWDSRSMVMIPAAGADAGQWDAAVSHGRNTRNHQNHHGSLPRDELEPRATSAATMPHAVRCAREGCGVVFHYSMQSRVRTGSVFCAAHQPVGTHQPGGGKIDHRSPRGSADEGSNKSSDGGLPEPGDRATAVSPPAAAKSAARIRGDGTAKTTGLKAFLALRDSTGTWSSMACRVCGYVQGHASKGGKNGAGGRASTTNGAESKAGHKPGAGKVMNAVSSRSSLDCGCMRKWEVVIDGLSYRFCSGCKLYHELKYFENEKSAKKPSKVCAVFKERRRLRKIAAANGTSTANGTPSGMTAASPRAARGAADKRPTSPVDSVSPADSISGDGGGSLGSNDAANTGAANTYDPNSGALFAPHPTHPDVEDRFVVDGIAGRLGEERVTKLRQCSMFNHVQPMSNMFNRGAAPDGFDHFLDTFIDDPGASEYGAGLAASGGARAAPSQDFLRNAFSTFSAKVPGDVRDIADATGDGGDLCDDFVSSMLDGADGVDRHGDGARFGYLFPGSVIVGVDAVDLPEGCAARTNPVRAMRDLLFDPSGPGGGSLAGLAKEAAATGGVVAASVAGVLYRAGVDPNTGVPALIPAPMPRGALRPGAMATGSYAVAHFTDAEVAHPRGAGRTGSNTLARIELRGDVLGFGEVAIRCRFAGHYLPVRSAHYDGVRDVTVCEVCVAPPKDGFVALEGCAFVETYVACGELKGLPCGFPVPLALTSDVGVHAELRRALAYAAAKYAEGESNTRDDGERRAAWSCAVVATALAEAGRGSDELARLAASAAASVGATRSLALIMRDYARVPGVVDRHLPSLRGAVRTPPANSPGLNASFGTDDACDSFDTSTDGVDLIEWDEDDVEFVGESEFELAVASGRKRTWFAGLSESVTHPFRWRNVLEDPPGVDITAIKPNITAIKPMHGRDVHMMSRRKDRASAGILRSAFESFSWKSFDVVGIIFTMFYLRNRPETITWGHAALSIVCTLGMLFRAMFMSVLVKRLREKAARLRGEDAGSEALNASIRRDILIVRLTINIDLVAECWMFNLVCSDVFTKFVDAIYPLSSENLQIIADGGSIVTLGFFKQWFRLVLLCYFGKMLFNANLVGMAGLGDVKVPTWWNFIGQLSNHLLAPHVAFLPIFMGAMQSSRKVAGFVIGFAVADSALTSAVLLLTNVLRAHLSKPGTEGLGQNVPFSFSLGLGPSFGALLPGKKRD